MDLDLGEKHFFIAWIGVGHVAAFGWWGNVFANVPRGERSV